MKMNPNAIKTRVTDGGAKAPVRKPDARRYGADARPCGMPCPFDSAGHAGPGRFGLGVVGTRRQDSIFNHP
ncbi:MAG TPA: hypothetical protein VEY09_18245 [Pyrinomonadaceae bacterium]|nr:hypothetical protein [Pyrinomonadaceae bacterium]